MLVLSRKQGEKLVIGNDIVVTVLAIRGNIIRIGVDAPLNVRVMRQEVAHLPPKEREPSPGRYEPIGGYIDDKDPGSLLPPEAQKALEKAVNNLVGDDLRLVSFHEVDLERVEESKKKSSADELERIANAGIDKRKPRTLKEYRALRAEQKEKY